MATIDSLDVKLDMLIDMVERHLEDDNERFAKIETQLHGDGNGHRGLDKRVDRLEVVERNRKWHIRTIWGAVVAGAVGYFTK